VSGERIEEFEEIAEIARVLEAMWPDDHRSASYRKALTDKLSRIEEQLEAMREALLILRESHDEHDPRCASLFAPPMECDCEYGIIEDALRAMREKPLEAEQQRIRAESMSAEYHPTFAATFVACGAASTGS
jgi:hypothetical protein